MRRSFLACTAMAVAFALAAPACAGTVDSLIGKSRAAEKAGRLEEALRYAQAAVVADPGRASSYAFLGDVYLHADRHNSAAFYYHEALSIDPQNHVAVEGLARAETADKTNTAAVTPSLDKPDSGQ